MRIIGFLDTKGYKTTVFKNNEKFIVKFESELFEQVFKFKESSKIEGLNHIRNLIDDDFLKEIEMRSGKCLKVGIISLIIILIVKKMIG